MPFFAYADAALHLQKALVLWGKGGRGKTQAAKLIPKHIASGHGTKEHSSTSNVDALKFAQHEFSPFVPVALK